MGSENDRAFATVLKNSGNVDVFLDEFFGFLARRTDFFVVSPPQGGNIGFPPGIAAKLVIAKYKKWEEHMKGAQLPVGNVEEVESPSSSTNSHPADIEESLKSSPSLKPKKESKPQAQSILSDSYNGRKTDNYSWSQSIKDLEVQVAVRERVRTKHDVKIDMQSSRIKVTLPGSKDNPILVDWTLPHPIVKDESFWSLHPGESILFSLQKAKERWWDHLFEGEEPLERNKIDAVRPMDELDDEEQAKIQELVWNQEQKLKGLPTAEESKLQDIMKKAWDAEGSPFKGQPFDPSLVQLANNSIMPEGFHLPGNQKTS